MGRPGADLKEDRKRGGSDRKWERSDRKWRWPDRKWEGKSDRKWRGSHRKWAVCPSGNVLRPEMRAVLTRSPPPHTPPQAALLSLGAAARCGLCCIHGSGGRPLAATAPWRALPRSDAALLGALVTSGATTSAAARDLPVFLPHGSPTVRAGSEARDAYVTRKGKLGLISEPVVAHK